MSLNDPKAVSDLKAESHAEGYRIDLSWKNPAEADFVSVTIVRRERTFPRDKEDGEVLLPGGPSNESCSDKGLKGQTVYYYTVFASYENGDIYPASVSALTTSNYDSSVQLHQHLPAIYHRFDTEHELQKFLEIFGPELDRLRSMAAAARHLHDLDRLDGSLLPLLAQWIGWQNNPLLPLSAQRNAIRSAPHFYHTIGLAPNLQARVYQTEKSSSRSTANDYYIKEFFHNVFRSNAPPEFPIWMKVKSSGNWQPAENLVVDTAFEGTPTALQTAGDGTIWLFYHAQAGDASDIWCKTYYEKEWQPARRVIHDQKLNKYPAAVTDRNGNLWLFRSSLETFGSERHWQIKLHLLAKGQSARPVRLEGSNPGPFQFTEGDEFEIRVSEGDLQQVTIQSKFLGDLNEVTARNLAEFLNRQLSGVEVAATGENKVVLTSRLTGNDAKIELPNSKVAGILGFTTGTFVGKNALQATLLGSSHSGSFGLKGKRLVIRFDQDQQAVIAFDRNFTFADQVAEYINGRSFPDLAKAVGNRLQLASPTASDGSYLAVDVNASTAAAVLGFGAALPSPITPSDDCEPAALQDQNGTIWLFWGSRRSGHWQIWYSKFWQARWTKPAPLTMETEICFDRKPAAAVFKSKIWVFWARKTAQGWRLYYAYDFAAPRAAKVSIDNKTYDDTEPCLVVDSAGDLHLYWRSNRIGVDSIWHSVCRKLKPRTSEPEWETIEIIKEQEEDQAELRAFLCQAPTAVHTPEGKVYLWCRCNKSIAYQSLIYPAAQTLDHRYAGSTTVDTRNGLRIADCRGKWQDNRAYSYDVRQGNDNFAAFNAVGIYLPTEVNESKQTFLRSALQPFLPIQARPVFHKFEPVPAMRRAIKARRIKKASPKPTKARKKARAKHK